MEKREKIVDQKLYDVSNGEILNFSLNDTGLESADAIKTENQKNIHLWVIS